MPFLLMSTLGLCFSSGAHNLSLWNGQQLLGRIKCVHLWVCLIISGIILAEMTGVDLQRINILVECQYLPYETLILTFFPIASYLLFQTWMMHKEAMGKKVRIKVS